MKVIFPEKESPSTDRDLHEMSMSVQPDMGIALAGNVRLQINVQIEKIAGRDFSGKADRKFNTRCFMPIL